MGPLQYVNIIVGVLCFCFVAGCFGRVYGTKIRALREPSIFPERLHRLGVAMFLFSLAYISCFILNNKGVLHPVLSLQIKNKHSHPFPAYTNYSILSHLELFLGYGIDHWTNCYEYIYLFFLLVIYSEHLLLKGMCEDAVLDRKYKMILRAVVGKMTTLIVVSMIYIPIQADRFNDGWNENTKTCERKMLALERVLGSIGNAIETICQIICIHTCVRLASTDASLLHTFGEKVFKKQLYNIDIFSNIFLPSSLKSTSLLNAM
ncbi:hypothetical protein RFI_05844 [Reticulomyxa filosa]|uniref:Uncharacterized protein n=1 Tax=Reticulomyxa filosa TaxID=46433 RepID=X6NZK0_RETFI|nr:hypothetical protein RFI_05844 [Reticulomyxa filosa]|eukprot:ETO31274.1 hypothetical protein RFI_05844 [Reticulomyxa filosa]